MRTSRFAGHRHQSLATSLATPTGTWAVAVMGGSVASYNDFWQLFERPARTGIWRMVAPPGVASNDGMVLASLGTGVGGGRVPAKPGPVLLPACHHPAGYRGRMGRPGRPAARLLRRQDEQREAADAAGAIKWMASAAGARREAGEPHVRVHAEQGRLS